MDSGFLRASLVAQTINNLPATQETWVPSLGWEDPLSDGMAFHPVSLPGGLQSMGSQRLGQNGMTFTLGFYDL